MAAPASAGGPAITEFPVLAASFLSRSAEVLAVQAGTGMSFVITNGTGAGGNFDLFFRRAGVNRANGETGSVYIANGASVASRAFFFAEKGQYRLEITSRADGKTLLEYIFNLEE
jgi:hypothetical protein